jgi:hypothetical protein
MKNNPILYTYKGIVIRKYNRVELTFGEASFKKIIDEVDTTGLSIQKVLAYSGQPCEVCKGTTVSVQCKEGKQKVMREVRKGILHIPESNGTNLLLKAKERCKKQ